MDTSIINMGCNNSEVTVPAKPPKLYVIHCSYLRKNSYLT